MAFKFPKLDWWLLLLLLIAAVLRLIGFGDQEYSYDELSAIFRAENAKNWQQHISNGVIPDGHPAGLQTFIWLWIKLLGDQMLVLKFIMIACSLGAIFFIYKTGKIIFNTQTGALAGLLLAILHLPLFWSLQLRPYAPGMLASTGLLYTFSQLAFAGSQKRKYYLLSFTFISLAFYLHYFAGLTAFIIFISGFFILHKRQLLSWFLVGLGAVFLFIPHFSITLKQLSNKGLGWLAPPTPGFFWQHISTVFSDQYMLFLLVHIIAIGGLFIGIKFNLLERGMYKRLLFLWVVFSLPLLIGYFYSVYRAPVLQHSVLLFSLPALLLFMAFFTGFFPAREFKILFSTTAFAGIAVLVYNKKFYSVENQNPYRSEIECANYYSWKLGKKNVSIWLDGENDILEYHIQKNAEPGISYNRFTNYQQRNTIEVIKNIGTATYYGFGFQSGIDGNFRALLEEHFGLPIQSHHFNGGEFLLYAKTKKTDLKYSSLKPDLTKAPPYIYLNFKTLAVTHQDFMVIRLKSMGISGEIQTAILSGNQQIDWRSTQIDSYNFLPGDITYSTNLHVIKLADIPAWNQSCTLKINIQAEDHKSDYPIKEIGDFSWRIMKGNPYIYGIGNN